MNDRRRALEDAYRKGHRNKVKRLTREAFARHPVFGPALAAAAKEPRA